MTRKTLGYVHLEWTCPNCQRGNPGPQKFCSGCGAPQPENVEFHQAAEEKLLEDEAEIARAKAGPDIHCPYCGARNLGDAQFCGGCGGDLTDAVARESGRVVGAHRDGPAPEVNCPACATANPATAKVCSQCGANLRTTPAEAPAPGSISMPASAKKGIPIVGVIAGIVLCVVIAFAAYFLFIKTNEQSAEVRAVSWTRSIPILALGEVEAQDWWDEIPSDAEVGSCSSEYRYTSSSPESNSVEVCGTPYTVDTGSGAGEVVQDCEYQVYDDYCTYTVMDWVVFDEVTLAGSDLNPVWPQVNLLSDQKEGDPSEGYEVIFHSDGESYDYTPSDASEFSQYSIGSKWILSVNSLGAVLSVEPE